MAGKNNFSDEDLAGLTDEEKAALNDTTDDVDLEEAVGDLDEDSDDDQDDDAGDTDDVEVDASKDKPAAKVEEKQDLADFEEVEEAPQFIPNMRVEKVEDYDAKIEAITTKRDELLKQFDEGDIDLATFTKEDRALGAEEVDLKTSKVLADNQEKQNIHIQTQRWEWEQEQFFEQPANQIYADNEMLAAAFNAKVMALAKVGAESGSNKSGSWYLKEADKEVRKLFNIQPETKANVVDIKDRKPDLSKIPKTLGTLPQADNEDTNSGEFASLDRLTGMALENELARLQKVDPDKVERYLQQA
ncbi:MAG: hypothetical protein WC733_00100 [Methylophilus sp.]|jgi:hypothetical protein